MKNEIEHMQVRLFRLAWKKWNITLQRCSDIFDQFGVDDYIGSLYGLFHVQGDEANLCEIKEYLKNKGVTI